MEVAGGRPGFPDAEERVSEHSEEFERFCLEAYPLARRYALRAVDDPADADDIVQLVLVELFEDWRADPAAWARPNKLKGWMATAVRNCARNFHKMRRRREERQFVYESSLNASDTTWMEPEIAMRSRGLRRARVIVLAAMSEERRQCFLRKHQDNASYKEIAAALGISVSQVGENICFVNKAMREAENEYMRREA
jgi:RNA polymerase sigma factor (sigma-70 family)